MLKNQLMAENAMNFFKYIALYISNLNVKNKFLKCCQQILTIFLRFIALLKTVLCSPHSKFISPGA